MATALVLDYLGDLNGTGNVGDTLTTAMWNSGIQGFPAVSTSITGTAASMTIAASSQARLDQVYLKGSGTNFASGSTHRRFACEHTPSLNYVTIPLPANQLACAWAGWITPGPADIGAGGVLFDFVSIIKGGHNCICQLNNGNGGGGKGYSLNIESDAAGTVHSTYITVVPGTTYWCSLQADFIAGTCVLDVYDTSGSLISGGHVTSTVNTGVVTSDTLNIRLGNAETGTSAGNTTYIENWVIDYQKAAAPLGPVGPSNYWVPKYAGASASASGGGLPVTVTNVAVGDLIVVICKWEGTTTTCSVSDGTTAIAQTTVGVQNNGGANGEPHLAVFYLLASVASGSVTYTPTLGANKVFRDTVAFAVTPPTGTTVSLDGTAAGSSATSGTAANSGNTTTTGTNGMSVGAYAEFGATLTLPLVNAVRKDTYAVASATGNSAGWMTAYTSGFTGAATGTLSASNRWDAQVVSFKATAASGSDSAAQCVLPQNGVTLFRAGRA